MRTSLYALLFFTLSLIACTSEAGFEKGKHYVELGIAQPASTDGKIEVREFFWYGCPHCYRLEPFLETWLEKRPADVVYLRTPGVARRWIPHAKAYYAFEALGITEQVHRPFFDAIHKDGQQLADEPSIKAFLANYGVDGQAFTKAFNSFGVRTQVEKARQLNIRYGVESVPSVTVGGKYKTSATMAGSEPQLMQVINHLIEKIRQQR